MKHSTLVLARSCGSSSENVTIGTIFTKANFGEYDLIMVDYADLIRDFYHSIYGPKLSDSETEVSLDADEIESLIEALECLGAKIKQAIRMGRPVAIICREPVLIMEKGAFREAIDLTGIYPFSEFSYKVSHGKRISCVLEESEILNDMRYEVVLEGDCIIPILKVDKTGEMVGGVIKEEGGVLLLLPPACATPATTEIICAFAGWTNYLVTQLIANSNPARHISPTWVDSYLLSGENEVRNQLSAATSERDEIDIKIAKYSEELEEFLSWKALVYTSGDELEQVTLRALNDLGWRCAKGPSGQADIIAFDGEILYVVEVKGKSKSASKKDARQCASWVEWVSSELEDDEDGRSSSKYKEIIGSVCGSSSLIKKVRGILMVNAWKDLPPQHRVEACFPNDVTEYLQKKEITGITGAQLLHARFALFQGQVGQEVLNRAFQQSGLFELR